MPKKTNISANFKSLQEEVARLKKELEGKEGASRKTNKGIKVLDKELEEKNKKLQELSQLKSDFVSTVSHELRTPLSITKEGISLVLDKIPGKINEKQEEILVTARDNIDRLARIINDLLDISKIEAGKVELKKVLVDICNIVKDIYARWKLETDKKNQDLRISAPASPVNIYVDPDKINQILGNLILNAVKYTPEKGKIKVELKDEKGRVGISVSDTGIGIPKEDQPKVFGKFQQFGRTTGPGAKGTGLGLAIAKQLVEMHKGSIVFESKINKGSKFTFTLPKMDVEQIFREYVSNGIKEAADRKTSLSLMVVHIEKFDEFQKELGCEKTHNLLKDIQKVAKGSLRSRADSVVRDTGDLIILLSGASKGNVPVVRARIKKALSAYLSGSKEEWVKGLQITFGSATYPDEAASDKELLKKAKPILRSKNTKEG